MIRNVTFQAAKLLTIILQWQNSRSDGWVPSVFWKEELRFLRLTYDEIQNVAVHWLVPHAFNKTLPMRNKWSLELSNLLTEMEGNAFCQGRSSLPLAYQTGCQTVCHLEHFQGQKCNRFYVYLESVMNSGCKNADRVGNNAGALPGQGGALLAKVVTASDCLQAVRGGGWQCVKASSCKFKNSDRLGSWLCSFHKNKTKAKANSLSVYYIFEGMHPYEGVELQRLK